MINLPSPEPGIGHLLIAILGTLAAIFGTGWALLPSRLASSSKLLRSTLIGASGLLFLTGFSATLTLHRLNYLTLIPVLQIIYAAWAQWQSRKQTDTDSPVRDAWTKQDLLALFVAGTVVTTLFHVPLQRELGDGTLREVHSDLGYFAQQMMGIPEAGVANLWGAVLGDQSHAAGINTDLWYHWGSIFIAIGIHKVMGLPPLAALLDVTGSAMNFLLLLAAAATASGLMRGKTGWMLLVGALSILATQTLKVPVMLQWMNDHFPYGSFQHSKVSLALFFAYKYEGILVLSALAAWLHRQIAVAILMLFCACVSAPHTVAACAVTGAAILVIGLILRQRDTWRTGITLLVTPAIAWAMTILLLHAEMAGGGKGIVMMNTAAIAEITKRGLIETGISLMISILSLPGILHLLLAKDQDANKNMRTLAWMALGGILASCGAFQFLGQMADSFHVMLFVQTILVMPLGIWGLARMFQHSQGARRSVALAIIVACSLMGLHDLILPRLSQSRATWPSSDIAAVQELLNGQPFGYFAEKDRGWWIPERSVMASMIGSRVVRLNPMKDEQKKDASRYYGYTRPFQLLAPEKGENAYAWSLRFAEQLGIHYVVAFPNEPLPAAITTRSKQILNLPSMKVYELVDAAQ